MVKESELQIHKTEEEQEEVKTQVDDEYYAI